MFNGLWGLCPWNARVGDTLVVLHGGKVPYLLRSTEAPIGGQVGKRYAFIGEAYLDSVTSDHVIPSEKKSGRVETFR